MEQQINKTQQLNDLMKIIFSLFLMLINILLYGQSVSFKVVSDNYISTNDTIKLEIINNTGVNICYIIGMEVQKMQERWKLYSEDVNNRNPKITFKNNFFICDVGKFLMASFKFPKQSSSGNDIEKELRDSSNYYIFRIKMQYYIDESKNSARKIINDVISHDTLHIIP